MRVAGGVLLGAAATVIGLASAAWLSLAGLGWADGEFFTRYYWEEGEGDIGVGFAIIGLIVWAVLLIVSTLIVRGEPTARSRGPRMASLVVAAISVIGVVGLSILVLGWPEPPSEYPLPPWNRA